MKTFRTTSLGIALVGATIAGAQPQISPTKHDTPKWLQEARRRFWEQLAQENSWLPSDAIVQSRTWEQASSWSQKSDALTANLRYQGVVITLAGKQVGTKIQLNQIDVQEAGRTQSYRELAQVPENVRPRILQFLESWQKEVHSMQR